MDIYEITFRVLIGCYFCAHVYEWARDKLKDRKWEREAKKYRDSQG